MIEVVAPKEEVYEVEVEELAEIVDLICFGKIKQPLSGERERGLWLIFVNRSKGLLLRQPVICGYLTRGRTLVLEL
jgi:hypothetical protein